MIIKQVKQYAKRQRIDINLSDGLEAGSEVVILTSAEYEDLKSNLFKLQNENTAIKKELEVYQRQENNLKEIVEDTTKPIQQHYEKELSKKDKQVKQSKAIVELIKHEVNQHNLELMDLNLWDKLRGKDKDKILNFNKEFYKLSNDPKFIEAKLSDQEFDQQQK